MNKSTWSKIFAPGLVAALGFFSLSRAQDVDVSRSLTAEEKAFNLRTRKQLFDIIIVQQA